MYIDSVKKHIFGDIMPITKYCKCGNLPVKNSIDVMTGDITSYCEDCDPDPPVDNGHICHMCKQPSFMSTTLWGDVTVGICKKCYDTGKSGLFSYDQGGGW